MSALSILASMLFMEGCSGVKAMAKSQQLPRAILAKGSLIGSGGRTTESGQRTVFGQVQSMISQPLFMTSYQHIQLNNFTLVEESL